MISIRTAKQILKDAGAKRVSKESALKFRKILEEYAKEIAKEAVKKAQFAGRKVIKAGDIKSIQV